MNHIYLLFFVLFSHSLTAQSISITPLHGNKKSITIKENNIIYFKYKNTPKERKTIKIQGRLITVTDSCLVVKPLFLKEILTIKINQIVKIKKENIVMMSVGTAAFTVGTFLLLESVNEDGQGNLFASALIAPVVFLLAWNNLLNPMKNVAPHYYTKNNQWIINFHE